jgi:hypothetical protein
VVRSIVDRWKRYWFAPQGATTLGVCRIAFFALLFAYYLTQAFSPWGEAPRSFWKPIWAFEEFDIPVLGVTAMGACGTAWKVALALSCIGLFTRVSTAAAFVLGFYLLGLRHSWGKAGHEDAATVLILLTLAFSRCGDALSLDSLLRRRAHGEGYDRIAQPSGEYRWPIRAIWLIFAMVFFNAAVAKLRESGLHWAWSDNLAVLMVRLNYFNKPKTDWGLFLANLPGFGKGMGVSALAVELFAPLLLFSRAARWVLVPSAFLMQLGHRSLLGVDFTVFMFA